MASSCFDCSSFSSALFNEAEMLSLALYSMILGVKLFLGGGVFVICLFDLKESWSGNGLSSLWFSRLIGEATLIS